MRAHIKATLRIAKKDFPYEDFLTTRRVTFSESEIKKMKEGKGEEQYWGTVLGQMAGAIYEATQWSVSNTEYDEEGLYLDYDLTVRDPEKFKKEISHALWAITDTYFPMVWIIKFINCAPVEQHKFGMDEYDRFVEGNPEHVQPDLH